MIRKVNLAISNLKRSSSDVCGGCAPNKLFTTNISKQLMKVLVTPSKLHKCTGAGADTDYIYAENAQKTGIFPSTNADFD